MGYILAVLGSGRSKGYTSQLLKAASDSAAAVEGVAIEWVHLHRFEVRPCTSCFQCIREPGSGCILDDDFGRKNEGALFAKVRDADAFLIGDAVHNWTSTAAVRLFFERLYPFLWTGELRGSHFASISCASNSGMHREAARFLCQQSFSAGFRYVGGLAVHVADFERARREAAYLGRKLGLAAREGRKPVDEQTLWSEYAGEMWDVYPQYLDNLTAGTLDYNRSLPEQALRHGAFEEEEARRLAEQAAEELRETLRLHGLGNHEQARRLLVKASGYWVQATWREYVQEG